MKRILTLLLSAIFIVVMLAACSGGNQEAPPSPTPTTGNQQTDGGDQTDGDTDEGPPVFEAPDFDLPDKAADVIRYTADGKRHIIIASFYDRYYDSTHTSVFDNPSVNDPETAQMVLDQVRYVEEKYNVYIEFVNMTWDGLIENIPVSIMSGIPDADIYFGETAIIVPAILNGMATALEDMDIDPEFKSDLFAAPGENIVMESVKIPGQDKTYMFRGAGIDTTMYMLGYNREMLQAKGLEDPQDLWDKGEWTWDVFREYCRVLTDASQNIYGYSGYWKDFMQGMLFANNTAFAGGPTQTLDDPKTLEVLNFISDLYNVDKTARPWDPADWEINNKLFAQGLSGFWIAAHWINDEFGGLTAPFDIGMVPFPIGPSGNAETNPTTNIAGSYFFIPRYIQDPGMVLNVLYDLSNWFEGDLEYRDDIQWFKDNMISEANFEYYMKVVGRPGFDLFMDLGFMPDGWRIMETTEGPADYTPAQYVETYKQVFQDALDNYFK